MLNFTRPVCDLPVATITYPAYIISEFFLKTQNSDPTERGNMVENSPTYWRSFRKPGEKRYATGSVTELFESIEIKTPKGEETNK